MQTGTVSKTKHNHTKHKNAQFNYFVIENFGHLWGFVWGRSTFHTDVVVY